MTLPNVMMQMENIQMFLTFCEHYGVPKTNLFQTVDLYEGTNMPQFLSCVQCLGTEVSTCYLSIVVTKQYWYTSDNGTWLQRHW